jgi:hypothetical protein
LTDKNMMIKLKIFLAFLFLIIGIPFTAHAADLKFSPSSGTFTVGQTFPVNVIVDSQDQPMNAVQAVVNFTAGTMEVVSFMKEPPIIDLWIENPAYSNSAGTASFQGIAFNPGYTGPAGHIITINFRPKAVGTGSLNFAEGKVLANDGDGTDITGSLGTANYTFVPPPPEPAGVPSISSPTHPDQNRWYSNNNPQLQWTMPASPTGVSYVLDQTAGTVPDTVSEGVLSLKSYSGLEDGIWYFHARTQTGLGWGDAGHFRLQVDITKPEYFNYSKISQLPGSVKLHLDSFDITSGIDHYEIKVDSGSFSNWVDDGSHTYSVTNICASGPHTITARAVDRAGNYLEKNVSFTQAECEGQVVTNTIYITVTTTLPCEATTTAEVATTCLPVFERVTTTVYTATTCPVTIVEQTLTVTKEIAAAPQIIYKQIRVAADNPVVQKTAERVVVPTAIGIVVAGLLPFISWLDFLPFLRLLFLQPLMLLGLRRRAKWGKVYNSLNKMPVDLAIVRLFNAENNRLVQSKVTDLKGHYIFIVGPGRYRIEVRKDNFIFPSNFLAGMTEDGLMTDIYHGEIIEVTDINTAITATVPLDPVGVFKKPFRLFLEKAGRRIQFVLSVLGIIATAVSLYISPKWYIAALLVLHVVLFILFRRLSVPKVKGWGIVYDEADKKPLPGSIVRLFNSRLNKLVGTQIADSKGRYNFIAGDDKYYLSFEHKNYLPGRSALIDLSGKASSPITIDAGLKKGVIGGDTDVYLSSNQPLTK